MRPEIQCVIDLLDTPGAITLSKGRNMHGELCRTYTRKDAEHKAILLEKNYNSIYKRHDIRLFIGGFEISFCTGEHAPISRAMERCENRIERNTMLSAGLVGSAPPKCSDPPKQLKPRPAIITPPKKRSRIRRAVGFTMWLVGGIVTWVSITLFVVKACT